MPFINPPTKHNTKKNSISDETYTKIGNYMGTCKLRNGKNEKKRKETKRKKTKRKQGEK